MITLTKKGAEIFNGFDLSGLVIPVENSESSTWAAEMENISDLALQTLTGSLNGAIVKSSLSELNADLNYSGDVMAWVIGDSNQGNDGVYQKQGVSGSGSWSRIADLPYGVIQLNNTGAGTVNDIQASTSVNIPETAYGALLLLNITAANTGAVTLSLNGETAKPVVTNTNAEITSGYFVNGMAVLCVDDGTSYRLMSYGDASAIQAAAEAAQVLAEAAAASAVGVTGPSFNTIDSMITDAVLNYTNTSVGNYIPAGSSQFVVAASDAADHHVTTAGGLKLYAQPNADGRYSPFAFGTSGDGAGDGTGTQDGDNFNKMVDSLPTVILNNSNIIDLQGKTYRIEETISAGNVAFKNGTFDMSGFAAGDDIFTSAGGSISSAIALTADASHGDITITVADASSISADQKLFLQRDTYWDTSNEVRVSEMVHVKSVSGNVVTLYEPVDYSYPVSDNGSIYALTMVKGVSFQNMNFIGNPLQSQRALFLDLCDNPIVENCTFENFKSRAGVFERCFLGRANGLVVKGNGDENGTNYGWAITDGSFGCDVDGLKAWDVRHAVTAGGQSRVNRRIRYNNIMGYGTTDAIIDAHKDTDLLTITDVGGSARGLGSPDGVIFQGPRFTLDGASFDGIGLTRNGVHWQSQIAYSGVPHSASISNVESNLSGNRLVYVDLRASNPDLDGLEISNVRSIRSDITLASGVECLIGSGHCENINITGVKVADVTSNGVKIKNESGGTCKKGSISNSQVKLSANGYGFRIQASDSDGITDFTMTGLTAEGDSGGVTGRGIRTDNTNYITGAANNMHNTTTPYSVAGSNSDFSSASNI